MKFEVNLQTPSNNTACEEWFLDLMIVISVSLSVKNFSVMKVNIIVECT